MNIRRLTLAAGAATGGLLTAGFLHTAVAFAAPTDTDDPFTTFGGDVSTTESTTQLTGLDTTLDTDNSALATTLTTDIAGGSGTVATAADGVGAAPTGDDAFAELLPAGASTTDQTEAADLDNLLYAGLNNTADAGDASALATAAAPAPTPDVFGFTAVGNPDVATVSGIPPYFQDFSGTQAFDTAATTGTSPVAAGSFTGAINEATTSGFSNQEILVTDSSAGVTTAPMDGSVYDAANFGSGYENIYSDVLTAPAADAAAGAADVSTVTDTFVTPFGNIDLTPYIDFMAALDPSMFDLASVVPAL